MSRKFGRICFTLLCCLVLSIAVFQAPSKCYAFIITIDVAPNTLNIQSQGTIVTVHTDIAYGAVMASNVYLNGIPIDWSKADNQGNFVAKFLMSEVKALADTGGLEVPGENLLELVGYTKEGVEFIGTQTITVIDVEPAGAGGK